MIRSEEFKCELTASGDKEEYARAIRSKGGAVQRD